MEQIKKAKSRYNLSGDIPTTIITSLPELITVHEIEQKPDNLKDAIIFSTERACEQVILTRKREGTFLIEDIKERMQSVQNMVVLLKGCQGNVIEG